MKEGGNEIRIVLSAASFVALGDARVLRGDCRNIFSLGRR